MLVSGDAQRAACAPSDGRARRSHRGLPPGRNEKARPAEQVSAQHGEQKTVSGDPADGFEDGEGASDELWRGGRRCQRRQRQGEHGRLCTKAANQELPALIGHGRLAGGPCGRREGKAIKQARTRNSEITVMLKRSHGSANSGSKETVRLQRRER